MRTIYLFRPGRTKINFKKKSHRGERCMRAALPQQKKKEKERKRKNRPCSSWYALHAWSTTPASTSNHCTCLAYVFSLVPCTSGILVGVGVRGKTHHVLRERVACVQQHPGHRQRHSQRHRQRHRDGVPPPPPHPHYTPGPGKMRVEAQARGAQECPSHTPPRV